MNCRSARFDEEKATSAAALFLRLAGGRLNYMVLMKFLYLANRLALERWAVPVFTDECFSMKNGPVLSHVYDLVTDPPLPDEDRYWARHISAPSNYEVELISDHTHADALSDVENDLIQEVYELYKEFKGRPFDFTKHLRRLLPELEQLREGRSPISLRSILLAVHKSTEEINQIEDDLKRSTQIAPALE